MTRSRTDVVLELPKKKRPKGTRGKKPVFVGRA